MRRLLEKRARLLVGRQQAHHLTSKVWIVGAGAVQVRLTRGRRLQQRLVENRPQAPMPVGGLAHRSDLPRGTRRGQQDEAQPLDERLGATLPVRPRR